MNLTRLTILSLCLAIGACASHIHTPLTETFQFYRTNYNSPSWAYFQYEQRLPPYNLSATTKNDSKHYTAHFLNMPATGVNGQQDNLISADYYRSKTPGKRALVIVLPLYGAYTYPPDEITQDILSRSAGEFNVLNVQGEHYMIDWEALMAAQTQTMVKQALYKVSERMRINIADIRRLIDWAETQSDVDAQRIALIGFSHGAMVSSMAAVVEPRIHTNIFVMGGANPHEIFAVCPLERTGGVRETLTKRFGWSEQQYLDILKDMFETFNPANYPGQVNPRHTLLIDAKNDECMPESSRNALWEVMGRPERYSFKYGHKMSFMAMTPLGGNFMRRIIFDFLARDLINPPAASLPIAGDLTPTDKQHN